MSKSLVLLRMCSAALNQQLGIKNMTAQM